MRQNRQTGALFTGCSAYPSCAFAEPHDPRVQTLSTAVVQAVQTLATQFWAYAEQGVSFGAAAPYAAAMMVMSAVPAWLLGRWFDRRAAREPGQTPVLEAVS